MNVGGETYASSGMTARSIEKVLSEKSVDPKAPGKYDTIIYDKKYSNYLMSVYFPKMEKAANDEADDIIPWTGVHVWHKKEWKKLAAMFKKAQGRIVQDQVITMELENLYNSWVPFANFTDTSYKYAFNLAKMLGNVDDGGIILPDLNKEEISDIRSAYQNDKIEMPFNQSSLTGKLQELKANGNELSSARHEMQVLYAQRTIDRLKREISPSVKNLETINKNINDLKVIGGFLDKMASFALGGFNMATVISSGLGGMAADAIGYVLYQKEKQKLESKIKQFKSTVGTLRKVIKLNQYDAIIDRFHAAMNKRYAIIGDIYNTISERREAFQNMGEKMDKMKKSGGVKGMEHYTPELTLISAFREVGTMATKAMDPAYIPVIRKKAKEVISFVWQSRNYSRAIYGDCIWKYKRYINSTSYSEEYVVESALNNVKKFEEDSDIYKALIDYEKTMEKRMKSITAKYNDMNVKY